MNDTLMNIFYGSLFQLIEFYWVWVLVLVVLVTTERARHIASTVYTRTTVLMMDGWHSKMPGAIEGGSIQ